MYSVICIKYGQTVSVLLGSPFTIFLLFLMVLGTIPLILVIVTAGLMTLGCTYILDNFCRKDQKDFKRKQYGIVCINEQDRLADIHEE